MIPAYRALLIAGLALGALGSIGGAGLWLHHTWRAEGYAAATAVCEIAKAKQLAANNQAVADAGAFLRKAESDLSLKSTELTNALDALDATTAADPAGPLPGLPARLVRRLNAIR